MIASADQRPEDHVEEQRVEFVTRKQVVVIITAKSPYSPMLVLGRLRQPWTNSVSC